MCLRLGRKIGSVGRAMSLEKSKLKEDIVEQFSRRKAQGVKLMGKREGKVKVEYREFPCANMICSR